MSQLRSIICSGGASLLAVFFVSAAYADHELNYSDLHTAADQLYCAGQEFESSLTNCRLPAYHLQDVARFCEAACKLVESTKCNAPWPTIVADYRDLNRCFTRVNYGSRSGRLYQWYDPTLAQAFSGLCDSFGNVRSCMNGLCGVYSGRHVSNPYHGVSPVRNVSPFDRQPHPRSRLGRFFSRLFQ